LTCVSESLRVAAQDVYSKLKFKQPKKKVEKRKNPATSQESVKT